MTTNSGDTQFRELQNLREEVVRLQSRFSLLSDLNRKISSSLELGTVLQDIVDAACTLTEAKYGAVGVFDEAGKITQFITHGLSDEERARIGNLPQGLGVLGWLRDQPRPIRLHDISLHPRSVGFPPNHPPMKSFIGAPMRVAGEIMGNIYLTEKTYAQEFTPEDESLLILFSAQAALAIRNAHLFSQVSDLATERGQLLASSEFEKERINKLVDTSPTGVFVINEQGTTVLLNQEGQRILGYDPSNGKTIDEARKAIVYRKPDGSLYKFEDLPLMRSLSRGETIRAEEIRLERPDGHTIPVLVNSSPIYSPDGKIISAIAALQDITPLEEMERMRSEFLGMVSHELRTPLTAIKGSAATVLGSRNPFSVSETRELFQIIDDQADRLRELVDNLLDITRIEAGVLSVHPEATDLAAVIKDVVATFARVDSHRQVSLNVPSRLPQVNADKRRVPQVITNLLNNAAKFSPPSEAISLDVTAGSDTVTVAVSDRGMGIAEDKLHQLFKKFSRLNPEDDGKLSGTGLGLAICKGIVEAHGGRIWAESAGIGMGTKMIFTLPIAAAAPAAPSITKTSNHMGKVRKSGERTLIMAVDDDPQILRYIQRSLDEGGYQPIVTGDPTQVIAMVEKEEPDLILMDMKLPKTTGMELLKRIREFSGVPLIFLTANDEPEDTVKALKAGADDYMIKPFSNSELLARIEAALRRRVTPDLIEAKPPFVLNDLSINFAERRVMLGSKPITLSATEYKLLYELATNAGRVLTHDQLLKNVWGSEYSGATELVRSFIRNLRKKLGDDAKKPKYILTESQVGYRMPKP